MKRLPVLLIFLILLQTAFSQKGTIIKGVVYSNSAPVEFANVILYRTSDSTQILTATVTDSLGGFMFKEIANDSYLLKVQMLGYVSSFKSFSIDGTRKELVLDTINMVTDVRSLNSVEVVAQRNMITKTANGFIISTKENITQAAGSATDLLRNTPTVVVDDEGNITVRGKAPLILVNGRNSSLSNTDRIPAGSVESIEINNNPSAKYEASSEGGIINITLKKEERGGTNGSVALGAGYGAKGRLTSALVLNHRTKKWNLGLSYDNRFAGRTRKIEGERINYNIPDEYYLIQNRHDERTEQTHNLNLNADFTPDKRNEFGLEVIGNLDLPDNHETLVSRLEKQDFSFTSQNSRHSDEYPRERSIEAALNYSRKFDDKRRNLSANLSTAFEFDTENTGITTQSMDSTGNFIENPFYQQTHNYQTSNITNLGVDYAHPRGKKQVLETGYKGILRITDADYERTYLENGEYVPFPAATSLFHFGEQVHALYLMFKNYSVEDSTKWKIDLGLRGELTSNHGDESQSNVSFSDTYLNLFPFLNVAWHLNSSDFFKITLSRRINRPDLEDLDPFIDITDSLNPHGGNPYLKPELVNAAELGFNKEWKKVSSVSNVFYRYSTDIIRNYISVDSTGVALAVPENFGYGITYGFEELITAFPVKFWNFNLSMSVYKQIINGSNVNIEAENDLISWYGKFINNFTLWKGGMLQVIGTYNSPIATPQGTRIGNWYIDAGFRQKMFNGRGALGISATDIFNTLKYGTKASGTGFSLHRTAKSDTRAVMVTFTWSFRTLAKEELLENRFSNE